MCFQKYILVFTGFFRCITLSFLYRPLLYNFLDNNYTRQYFYFSIPYLIILLFHEGAISNTSNPYMPDKEVLTENGFMIDDYYYDDLGGMYCPII